MEEGEFVSLMGPSGSGKSTFLNIVAGLITPDSGRVTVAGAEISRMNDSQATRFRRRNIGFVFQAHNLIESMTVEENIYLGGKLDGARLDKSRCAMLMERLGLEGMGSRHPFELSGGECQRVAIARALYIKPSIILADEPTGNLDMKTSRAICELLREANASEKCAILLVTHDPVVASVAERVCFLKDGAIVESFPSSHDPSAISQRYLSS